MGLPDYPYDTYRRYKADTSQVFDWLAQTARKSGYSLPAGSSATDSPATKSNLNKATSSKTTAAGNKTHKLTIQQVMDIAEWIAKLNPPVPVPNLMVTLLQSSISARKRCARWFQSNAKDENAKNTTHNYFIDVLERVLQILHLSAPEAERSKSYDISSPASEEILDVAGNFGILSIEESEVEAIKSDVASKSAVSRTTPPSASTKQNPIKYEIEFEIADDDETYFALFCFFTDLKAIRDFILDLWRDYRAGQTDLVTASLTTNLAFGLGQRAERDLLEEFPMFKSYKDVWISLTMEMCKQRGIDPIHLLGKSELVPPEMRDIADFLYINMYNTIRVM